MEPLTRAPDETFDEYLVRLFSNKNAYGLSCQGIADLLNKDNGLSLNEATYRKDWASHVRWKQYFDAHSENREDAILKSIAEERVRLRDERTEFNKLIRDKARSDDMWMAFGEKLSQIGEKSFPPLPAAYSCAEEGTALICLSDIHYGLAFNNAYGRYNSDICREYLGQYAEHIKRICGENGCRKCVIALMGDLINGNIHTTARISNREDLIEQVKGISESLCSFVYSLTAYFDSIEIVSVAGNHSRVDNKDDALNNERLDNIIPWFLRAALKHLKIVHVSESDDSTFTALSIEGHDFWFVHGDYDEFSEQGIFKLATMCGCGAPYAAVYGHMHQTKYISGNVHLLQSGCFAGPGDEYTVRRRLGGVPSQMMALINKDGIAGMYPAIFH